jgi:hypothetical protein
VNCKFLTAVFELSANSERKKANNPIFGGDYWLFEKVRLFEMFARSNQLIATDASVVNAISTFGHFRASICEASKIDQLPAPQALNATTFVAVAPLGCVTRSTWSA